MEDILAPIYVLANYMNTQPKYCVFNFNQNIVVLGSYMDVLYLDIEKETEMDIDQYY